MEREKNCSTCVFLRDNIVMENDRWGVFTRWVKDGFICTGFGGPETYKTIYVNDSRRIESIGVGCVLHIQKVEFNSEGE